MNADILRTVVLALGSICGLCVGGIVITSAAGHEPPAMLGAIASMCSGSLVGILVTPPRGNGNGGSAAPAVPGSQPLPAPKP